MADQGPKPTPDQAQIEAIIREVDPNVLSKLPEEFRPRVLNLVREVTLHASLFSGPLPPPDALQGYENISPGFANRILVMAEQQSVHRQELERSTIAKQMRQSGTGPMVGLYHRASRTRMCRRGHTGRLSVGRGNDWRKHSGFTGWRLCDWQVAATKRSAPKEQK